jgi:integrase
MAFLMLMRRLGSGEFTAHGFRSSARSWVADHGVEFEVAEQCLAHAVGNAVAQAYLRTTMIERRRPVMAAWADFISPEKANNAKVVALKRRARQ